MRAALALVCCLALVLTPAVAYGAPSGKPLKHEGKSGIWFELDAAKRILKDLTELKSIKQQLHVLEQLLATRKERDALYQDIIKDTEKLAALWKTTAQTQTAALERVTDPPFYKRPAFWFAMGFIAAAGLSIGLAAGLSRSTP